MRSGAALLGAAIAGLTLSFAGCGSQNTAPKSAPVLPDSDAAMAGQAGAAGATALAYAGNVSDYPDPSKLLEAYDAAGHEPAPEHQGKPSNSGLSLEVYERGPNEPWLLHIVNRGDQPAELVADTRLLWFEVKLPGKKKQSVCKLPEPLAITKPEPRLVVHLEPGEGVADQFDPRFYCFAEGDQKLLVPDAEVTPHFGWVEAPPKKRWKKGKLVEEPVLQKPPFVARQSLEDPAPPAGGGSPSPRLEGEVPPRAVARLNSAAIAGADKELEGATLTLHSDYVAWAQQTRALAGEDDPHAQKPALGLRLVQGSDAKAEHDATIQLTLQNQSPLPTYVYFRREMVSFEVVGPAGVTQCPSRLDDRTPERSSFLHLQRGAKRSYTSRLAELCPRGTFGTPGLYLVYARFDAALSGRDQGIDAFVGPVYSQKPATVRIRTGEQAIFQKRPMMRTSDADATNQPRQGTP